MICSNCDKNKLLLYLEEYIVSNRPTDYDIIETIYNEFIEVEEEDFECEECSKKVVKGESYILDEDGVSEIIFEYIAKQIMDDIFCCTECGEGADIQGLYASIKSNYYDEDDDPLEIFSNIDTASTVGDIMNDFFSDKEQAWGFWETYYEDIVEFVQCPKCSNGSGIDMDEKIDNGTFDLYTEVYTKSDIDRFNHEFYGDDFNDVKVEISEMAQQFTLDELIALKNSYIQEKTFIAQDSIFHKLQNFINELFTHKKYYILSKNRLVFRTRVSTAKKKLTKEELWEPPYESASHGRYNDIGTPVLYVANNRDIVKKEVSLNIGEAHNIAKIIIHESMKMFPINYVFSSEFEGVIDEAVPSEKASFLVKQQYIISNIVSAICNNVGYDGIVYRSTKDDISIDYALFCKYKKDIDLEVLDVEV